MRSIYLLVTFFWGINSMAQNKKVIILDIDSKTPIQSAIMQSQSGNVTLLADENGLILLNNDIQKNYYVTISCVGYKAETLLLSKLNFTDARATVYLQKSVSSLKDVVVSSSSKTGLFKTISDLDIHLRPINNSQEVLRMVPGLFIGQHAGGGKAEQIFLRGFDIDHGTDINISVDGMPVNMVSHSHGQGYADLHFLIPELIQKVNFNKGPYFADKGNFTTAGYVEFRTKDYLTNSFAKIEAGQFNTARVVTGINLLKAKADGKNQSLYIAGEGSYTKGFFASPQDFSRVNGIIKYRTNLNNQNTLTATATAFSSKWNASGQIPDRVVDAGTIGFFGAIDPNEGGNTSRYNVNFELLSYLNDGGTIRNQLFYSKYNFELYSNFTFFKEDPINGDQIRQKENRNIFGYNSIYHKEYYIGKYKTETNAGVQIRYDDVNDIELTRTKNRTIDLSPLMMGDVTELNVGSFYSQRISLTKKMDITGAVRVDYFTNKYNDKLSSNKLSSNSTILSPKLNFNYKVNNNVKLYLYNGRGFHSNDTRVAVQQNGKKVLPPAYGSDLGGIFKIGDKMFLQTAFWYLWLDQEFVYVGDEGVVEAGGQTRRYGIDVSVRYELARNLYADIDLNFTNPRSIGVPATENYIPLAPRITSIGGITYRKLTGWNGSLRYRYMADRPANESNSVIAKGYFVTDAAVNFSKKKWEAGFSIQNLFNVKWKETQFDTESQLQTETSPVSEIHFTPGTPFYARLNYTVYF
jgi:outer membrane cobalamin receptor